MGSQEKGKIWIGAANGLNTFWEVLLYVQKQINGTVAREVSEIKKGIFLKDRTMYSRDRTFDYVGQEWVVREMFVEYAKDEELVHK